MSGLRAAANGEGDDTFDDTGAALTTDELAASRTGYPARPDAEKRARPAFFRNGTSMGAFLWWKSHRKLVTASEVKRNCARATEQGRLSVGRKRGSNQRGPMDKNRKYKAVPTR